MSGPPSDVDVTALRHGRTKWNYDEAVMDGSILRRLRRPPKSPLGEDGTQPSELRQALADLGRVIGAPLLGEPGAPAVDPYP